MSKDICTLTVLQQSELLRKREISSLELTRAYLENCENDPVNAYITVCGESALKAAEKADKMLSEAEVSPLCGIPFAVKDTIVTEGVLTTAGSLMLENYIPTYTATAVSRLITAGGVMLGKTNTDEFAMGSTTETSAYKTSLNPLCRDRIAGGSSGGSAAAVCVGLASYALGSDTGGSVRQPAALCGIYGLKPTYGSVSRSGLISFAPSLDQIGPMTRTAEDAELVFNAIRGKDKLDSTSVEFCEKERKIGRISLIEGIDYSCIAEYIDKLSDRFVIDEKKIPDFDSVLGAYKTVSRSEAFSNLARYDGIRYGHRSVQPFSEIDEFVVNNRAEGFGDEVKNRILCGAFALGRENYDAYYLRAEAVREKLRESMSEIFSSSDAVVLPTVPDVAPLLKGDNFAFCETCDKYNALANLTGLPSLSIPIKCGSLSVGMQVIGDNFTEGALLSFAKEVCRE